MKLLISAGGTGGHICPALAVADEFINNGVKVVFVGTGSDLEYRLLKDSGVAHEVIEFVPIFGKGIGGIFKAMLKLPQGIFKAVILLRRFRPKAVIGFGGYPSVIPILAAFLCRTKV